MNISIIICTRNRADDLRATLQTLQLVYVPGGWDVELLLVDNGSTDHTAAVFETQTFSSIKPRYVVECRAGLSFARNRALEEARGDILLFTDDDVRLPENWITGMSTPIYSGKADAVAGGVKLAPHLRRPWMEETGTGLFAETIGIDPESPNRMVGANMAIARHVTKRINGFDTNLGAGALGSGEETLFSQQLLKCGFFLVSAFDVVVEHHCSTSRLSRESLIKMNQELGYSNGYVDYHWRHSVNVDAYLSTVTQCVLLFMRLQKERIKNTLLRVIGTDNVYVPISKHEKYLVRNLSRQIQIFREMGKNRLYEKYGIRNE